MNDNTVNKVPAAGVKSENSMLSEESPQSRRFIPLVAVALLLVAGGVAGLAVWYFGGAGGQRAGQPVPAPRTVTFDREEEAGEIAAGETITLQPDQIRNAGIKTEEAGERLTAESDTAVATGVVKANAYRESPALSLVGGIVRSVPAELGENVSQGQTVAVVFSNELAEAQSRFIALRTEAENSRRNFERTQRLVAINSPGRSEFEAATKQSVAADAALAEMKARYERTLKLQKIGAASREEVEQDTTKLRSAEAEAQESRLRLERSRVLLDLNPETRRENEEAHSKLRTAESELATAREKLVLYGMPRSRVDALRNPSQVSSELSVPAPASGTVTARSVNPGQVVEGNSEILRVTNLADIWVIAQVFERDFGRLRVGTAAEVASDAYPDRIFRGRVAYIDPTLDEATRSAQVRIELANPDRALKLGMYVRATFTGISQGERSVAVVPAGAVQNIKSRQVVFVATADPNTFEVRPVRLGAESDRLYPVLEGLQRGEKVVTEGSFLLRAEYLKRNP